MIRNIIKIYVLSFLLLSGKCLIAQKELYNQKDTLRYKCAECIYDTLYLTRERLKESAFKQVEYYLFRDSNKLSTTVVDTFIIGKTAWQKIYNNDAIPFLSVKDFEANKKGYEYLDREKKEIFYREYEPVGKIKVRKKNFYLYKVKPMSGKGMVESLGDDIYYVVFDFTIGEVYRTSYRIKKVLVGFEKFVPYFKW